MLPVIVVETLVSPFKFWRGGVHQGMLFRNDVYLRLQQFASTERMQAHLKAMEESNHGFKVCITVSKTHYTVWVELRSRLGLDQSIEDDAPINLSSPVLATV